MKMTKKLFLLLAIIPANYFIELCSMTENKGAVFYFYSKNKTYEVTTNKVRKSSPLFSTQIQSGMQDSHCFDFSEHEKGALSEQSIECIINFIQQNYSAEIIDIEKKPYDLPFQVIDEIIDSKNILEVCHFADVFELEDLFKLIKPVVFPKIIYKNNDPDLLEKENLEQVLPQKLLDQCTNTITLNELFKHYCNKKLIPDLYSRLIRGEKKFWGNYQPLRDDCTELMAWLIQCNNDDRKKQIKDFLQHTFFFEKNDLKRHKQFDFITRLLNILKNNKLTQGVISQLQNHINSDPYYFILLAQELFSTWRPHDTCFTQEIEAILLLLRQYITLTRERNSYYLSNQLPGCIALLCCFCDEDCCCLFTNLAKEHRERSLAKLQSTIVTLLQNWPDYPTE